MAEKSLGKVAITPRGQYDPSMQYEKLDVIRYDGSSYMVLKSCKGITPEEGEYYMAIATRGPEGPAGKDGSDANVINPNLLRNWNFCDPIREDNIKSSKNYISQWKLSFDANYISYFSSGGIVIKFSGENSFHQYYTNPLIVGKTYTASVLFGDYTEEQIISICSTNVTVKEGLVTFQFIPKKSYGTTDRFDIYTNNDKKLHIIAVKVEIGSRQTLAEQNEDGTWSIIDHWDKAAELAKCSMYDSSYNTNMFEPPVLVYPKKNVNPNLLINYNFSNPINSIGKDIYENTDAGVPTIDMWISDNSTANIRRAINDAVPNTIQITRGINPNIEPKFYQIIRCSNKANNSKSPYEFKGSTVTASILTHFQFNANNDVLGNRCELHLMTYYQGTLIEDKSTSSNAYYNNLLSFTITFDNTQDIDEIRFVIKLPDKSYISLVGAKLEFGDQQTLAEINPSASYTGYTYRMIDVPDKDVQRLLCIGNDSLTGVSVPLLVNPNLLINSDFTNPVNRQGRSNYDDSDVYTIDGWRVFPYDNGVDLNITGDGIRLSYPPTLGNYNCDFGQVLSPYINQLLANRTVTISAMINDQLVSGTYHFGDSLDSEKFRIELQHVYDSERGYVNYYLHICRNWNSKNEGILFFCFNGTIDYSILIKAVKLEFGSQQTLAHQDENGNWVLNEANDYNSQYAKCLQYDPVNWAFIGDKHSNPNLLDNWYFDDPIHQKGLSEYNGSYKTYTIDRWFSTDTRLTVNVDNGVVLSFSGDSADDFHGHYRQTIANPNNLVGRSVTLSFLVEPLTGPQTIQFGFVRIPNEGDDTDSGYYKITNVSLGGELQLVQITTPSFMNGKYDESAIYITGRSGHSIKLHAAKLELGVEQTLAHQDENGNWVLDDAPPNKTVELVKCQRHFIVYGERTNVFGTGIATSSKIVMLDIPTPVSLFGTPTVSFEDIGLIGDTVHTSHDTALDVISFQFVMCNVGSVRLQAVVEGATPGAAYMLVVKTDKGYFQFDANL